VDLDKLREIIRIFEQSELSEIEIEEDGKRMRFKKPDPRTYSTAPIAITAQHLEPAAQIIAPDKSSAAAPKSPEPVVEEEERLPTIDSPMVGVFYASPAPNEPPFVRPGDSVTEHQTVCIVEAMKLMNEVAAKFNAVIVKILVENGEPVEYGQPLFTVRPLEAT
jgi:acetyl-CoA carboxylase biotin carboxyl carrier protein